MRLTSDIEIVTLYASEEELEFLLNIMQEEKCNRVLEIGSKFGRMLLRWGAILPKGSRICSIDKPGGDWGQRNSEIVLQAVADKLRCDAFDVHLFNGDSGSSDAIDWARRLGPYDLIFIDADHTYKAVMRDWQNYAGFARLIAFHDISSWVNKGLVRRAYKELRVGLRYEECIENDETPGMGVIWT